MRTFAIARVLVGLGLLPGCFPIALFAPSWGGGSHGPPDAVRYPQPAPDATWWCALARTADGRTTSACERRRDDCDHAVTTMTAAGARASTCQPRGQASCFTGRDRRDKFVGNCFAERDECESSHATASASLELAGLTACERVH